MNDNEPQIIYENETQNVVLRYQLNRTEIVSIFVRIFRRLSKKNCSITNAVTTESYELKEALLYYKLCLKTYIREFYPAG